MANTIEINGHKFVESVGEFDDIMLMDHPEYSGFYKVKKRTILLFDKMNEPMAFINQELVLGAASNHNGEVWYSYLPFNHFLSNDSYLNQMEELEALTKGRDRIGYYFK